MGRTKIEIREAIVRGLIMAGLNATEIAEKIGITRSWLYAYCKQHDIDAPWKRKPKDESEKKESSHFRVYYELISGKATLAFRDIRNRDRAYDYCTAKGLRVYKSACGKAETIYDGLLNESIYNLLTN